MEMLARIVGRISSDIFTFFGLFSNEKVFHLWTIMFTYLGLAAAWLYYRNHGEEEENVDTNFTHLYDEQQSPELTAQEVQESKVQLSSPDNEHSSFHETDSELEVNKSEIAKEPDLSNFADIEESTDLNAEENASQTTCNKFQASGVVFSSENLNILPNQDVLCCEVNEDADFVDFSTENKSFHESFSDIEIEVPSCFASNDIVETKLEGDDFAPERKNFDGIDEISDDNNSEISYPSETQNSIQQNFEQTRSEKFSAITSPFIDSLELENGDKKGIEVTDPHDFLVEVNDEEKRARIIESILDDYYKNIVDKSENLPEIEKVEIEEIEVVELSNEYSSDDLLVDGENKTETDNENIEESDEEIVELLSNDLEILEFCGEYFETNEFQTKCETELVKGHFEPKVEFDTNTVERDYVFGDSGSQDSGEIITENCCDDVVLNEVNEESASLEFSEVVFADFGPDYLENFAVETENDKEIVDENGSESPADFSCSKAEDFATLGVEFNALTDDFEEENVQQKELILTASSSSRPVHGPSKLYGKNFEKNLCLEIIPADYIIKNLDKQEKRVLCDNTICLPANQANKDANENLNIFQVITYESQGSEISRINRREIHLSWKDLTENLINFNLLSELLSTLKVKLLSNESPLLHCSLNWDYNHHNHDQFARERNNLTPYLQPALNSGELHGTCRTNGIFRGSEKDGHTNSTIVIENSVSCPVISGRFADIWFNFDPPIHQTSPGEASPGKIDLIDCDISRNLNCIEESPRRTNRTISSLESEKQIVPNNNNCENTTKKQRSKDFAYDYLFYTTLAAVDSESLSEPSSSWETSEEFTDTALDLVSDSNLYISDGNIQDSVENSHESPNNSEVYESTNAVLDSLLDSKLLHSDEELLEDLTTPDGDIPEFGDYSQETRRSKRLSSSEIDGELSPKRPHLNTDVTQPKKRHVSDSFLIPFERKYEFIDNEFFSKHFDYQEQFSDSESSNYCDSDFDVDVKELIEPEFENKDYFSENENNSDEFVNKVDVKELFIEPSSKQNRDKQDYPASEMGQVSSSVLGHKGTLAMPVNDTQLRGIYVKNLGDYAVINRKHTRFSPLISEISVDRRLRITLEVPGYQLKAREIEQNSEKLTSSLEFVRNNVRSNPVTRKNMVGRRVENDFNSNQKIDHSRPQECLVVNTNNKHLNSKQKIENYENKKPEVSDINDSKDHNLRDSDSTEVTTESFDARISSVSTEHETGCSEVDSRADENKRHADENNTDLIKVESEFYSKPHHKDLDYHSVPSDSERDFLHSKTENSNDVDEIRAEESIKLERDIETGLLQRDFVEKAPEIVNGTEKIRAEESQKADVTVDEAFEPDFVDKEPEIVIDSEKIRAEQSQKPEVTADDIEKELSGADFTEETKDIVVDSKEIRAEESQEFEVAVDDTEIELSQADFVENVPELIIVDEEICAEESQIDFADYTEIEISRTDYEEVSEISIEDFEIRADESGQRDNDNAEIVLLDKNDTITQRDGLRSKSLSSLPKENLNPMAWFYRNRCSSVYFDDADTNIVDYGQLRKAKSAEITRKKPKIILSANYDRKPVKETNLDELMKSLENLKSPKTENNNGDLVKEPESASKQTVSEQNKRKIDKTTPKPILRIVRKSKSTTVLNQRNASSSKKETKSVAELINKFDSNSLNSESAKSMENISKQKPNMQRTKSCNLSSTQVKNPKNAILERSTVPEKDLNNNKSKLNSRDAGLAVNPNKNVELNSKDVLKSHFAQTNSHDSIATDLRSENISEIKKGLGKNNKEKSMKREADTSKEETSRIVENINEVRDNLVCKHEGIVKRDKLPRPETATDDEVKRTSIYGLTVVLTEAPSEKEAEIVADLSGKNSEDFWLQNSSEKSKNGDDLSKDIKVTDIDDLLNSAEYNESVDAGFGNDTPASSRARSSFRREKRLRKWLEDKQMSIDDDNSIDGKGLHEQSKRLKKIAIAEGINIKGMKDRKIENAILEKLESENKFTDFVAQLRYLINLEDDGVHESERSSKKDDINILKEYEISRQLRKGTSPYTSDDEGNASDAFTDITDASLSDYSRSRTSLNSLNFSHGSLHKAVSISEEHIDYNDDYSLEKQVIEDDITQKEVLDCEATVTDLFPADDISGLMSQAASAVKNRRRSKRSLGRSSKTSDHGTEAQNAVINPEITNKPLSLNLSDKESNLGQNLLPRRDEVDGIDGGGKYATNFEVYKDAPCSLLKERINEKLYNNLRPKLVGSKQQSNELPSPKSPSKLLPSPKSQTESISSPRSLSQKSLSSQQSSVKTESLSSSIFGSIDLTSLPSPEIKELRGSPQRQRRSFNSKQDASNKSPVYKRDSPFRKSTGSYDRAKEEHKSMPNLHTKQHHQGQSTEFSMNQKSKFPSVNLLLNQPKRTPARSPAYTASRSLSHSPLRSPVYSPLRSPVRSPIRSPHLSELEEEDYYDYDTSYSEITGFLSDSSLDVGAVFEGFDADDEDVFYSQSPRNRNISSDFDDFMAQHSDASSDEFFVPLNTRKPSARMHGKEISCAFPPCRNRGFVDKLQRTNFTSCIACFTYYCSKECRKAHWKEHKKTCYYGRVNYYTKALIRRFETNSVINEKLSEIALQGYQDVGRGCVLVTFSSPMAAKFFLVSGTDSFVTKPVYSPLNDISSGRITTKHQVLLLQTMSDYVPECEFVVDLTVYLGKQNEVRVTSQSRLNSTALLRCTKLPINPRLLNQPLEQPSETSYDIKVFYLPRSQRHHFINDIEARRHYCREVSYGLRRYGIQLKSDYRDVYDKLCLYVEDNIDFVPITLYGQANGRNYKCIIFPEGFNGHSGTVELQGRGMIV